MPFLLATSNTRPRASGATFKETIELGTQAQRVQKFEHNEPFVIKINVPLQDVPLSSMHVLVYDQSRRLSLNVSLTGGESIKKGGGGHCSAEDLRCIMSSVQKYGTGSGEFSPQLGGNIRKNVRGYMQACVLSDDCIRLFVDRTYQRQPW
jgi:hypothetical protein